MADPKRVLIIDDAEIVCGVVKKVVEMLKTNVIVARNGRQGLEKMADPDLDLVITDLLMPELTGWDIIEHLQRNPLTSDIPVIILTGTRISAKENGNC